MENKLMNNTLISANIDSFSTGNSQRWTIGELGDEISGAIYLPKNLVLPAEITICFLNKPENHEKKKEVLDKLYIKEDHTL